MTEYRETWCRFRNAKNQAMVEIWVTCGLFMLAIVSSVAGSPFMADIVTPLCIITVMFLCAPYCFILGILTKGFTENKRGVKMRVLALVLTMLMWVGLVQVDGYASGSTYKINPKYRLSNISWCRSDAPVPNFEFDAAGNKIPLALYKFVNGKYTCVPDRSGPTSFAWCHDPKRAENYGKCWDPAQQKYVEAIF